MTELDTHTLRRALRTQEDAADTIDIATIVRRGRSLRRRRRFAAVVGGACAAAALFGALTAIAHLTRPANDPARSPAISGRTTPGPSPSRPVPSASPRAAVATPQPKASPTATSSAVPSPSQTAPQSAASVTYSPGDPRVTPTAGAVLGSPSPTSSR
jgi:hypothetical protein